MFAILCFPERLEEQPRYFPDLPLLRLVTRLPWAILSLTPVRTGILSSPQRAPAGVANQALSQPSNPRDKDCHSLPSPEGLRSLATPTAVGPRPSVLQSRPQSHTSLSMSSLGPPNFTHRTPRLLPSPLATPPPLSAWHRLLGAQILEFSLLWTGRSLGEFI